MKYTASPDRLEESFSIRISSQMRAELEDKARDQERSLGSIVRRALASAMSRPPEDEE